MSDKTISFARRLVVPVLPVLALTLALVGCGRGDSVAPGEPRFAVVVKGLDNPFFQAMAEGAEATAQAAGIDATVQAAAGIADTTGQADKLTALANQDFSCFVVNPITGTNLVQALTQVSDANKPIVNIDSPVNAEAAATAELDIATYIGTDNEDAGAKAGDFVTSTVGPAAAVAIVGGLSGDVTSAARVDGFKAAAKGEVNIVAEVAADWKREIALTKATDILAANRNVKAFFAANDDMGLGIVKAVENAGLLGSITVVSVDGNADALQSVADGGLTATVAQYPYTIGSLGVQACQVATAGKQLPTEIESPTALVTKDVAAEAIAKFPQPFQSFDNPLQPLLTEPRTR